MRRREFIFLIGAGAAAWPFTARAQQTAIPMIGFLSPGLPETDVGRFSGLRRGLSEAGFVEGQNVTIEYRWAQNQPDRLPLLAADLVQHQVAVIIANGFPSTLAAKAATQTVPIVFVVGVDPVQLGLVASLNRPGGNLTGYNGRGSEVVVKQLQVLQELLPAASVGFLVNPTNPVHSEFPTRDVKAAARATGTEVQILHARTEAEIVAAFATLAQARIGGLIVNNDAFFNSQITQLVTLAGQYAIPTIHTLREFPLAGGLASYGYSNADIWRLIGLHVARVLRGEKPADLPVIQLSDIELVINLKTAKALGLTIPPTLFARANEVIE